MLLGLAGCPMYERVNEVKQPTYSPLPADKNLATFLHGTIMDRALVGNNTPATVQAYGLVGQLRGTGDAKNVPTVVRQFMKKELARRGFGDRLLPGYGHIMPGDVLQDPNYAIVIVEADIPPGAHKDDYVDVRVSCLPQNNTTSLAHGALFETDLKNFGVTDGNLGPAVDPMVRAKGPILVNPAYALSGGVPAGKVRASLRAGMIMGNGLVMHDRPLFLQMREPSLRTSRAIEARIQERFDVKYAKAEDEGIVQVFVPPEYRGDWEHFIGVVQHLWLESSPDFNVAKARKLADEATQPGTTVDQLQEISYAWEGLGKEAMPFIQPLLTDSRPQVAFAAARAAAFIGDPTGVAEDVLIRIANASGHPFQISAIRTLGALPTSSALNHKLRDLLASSEAVVRIEAYKVLARNRDSSVYTTIVGPADNPNEQKFALDIVPCEGPPLIYATRQGIPRIAVIGKAAELMRPITFAEMDNRLTITATPGQKTLTIYFREASDPARRPFGESGGRGGDVIGGEMGKDDRTPLFLKPPVKVVSNPDLGELVARLGGLGPRGDPYLDLTYAEVLAVVQKLADTGQFIAEDAGKSYTAAFVLQDPPRLENVIKNAPVITDAGPAPQLDGPGPAEAGRLGPSNIPPISPQ